ncbi:phosphoglucosamine mutase [Futiania mangrovi]|uniref:Phosphoglucosamine mutase n=1 Tax=Futiania mangrovi TaxID=2959716 RepID=A0A9J6P7N7_9PROT|nr:phosphoglucosamine mutase [Futiania mangrovii]MCP1334900.1 phosphoglucosamine mutase [Futiania mangrovii]
MSRRYFGTDGIRGTANKAPMTAEIALRVGLAAGKMFTTGAHRHRVVIGKDTRLSGYMVEAALMAGFVSVGMDVMLLGPVPTPAVGMLTRSLRADLGVMISASHNAFQDNGIKLFGPDGYKLSDEIEAQIEHMMENGLDEGLAKPDRLGRARRLEDAQSRYVEIVKASFPRELTLDGIRVVIDCANGAAYKVAPDVLWELGAEIVKIGVSPDGFNINRECGSTATGALKTKVVETRADIGIALDGDADRVIIVDEKGREVDGDQLMALIGKAYHERGRLTGGGIVATVMSNLGLERFLEGQGLTLARTKVGDRYVVEHMRAHGFNVGGEQSGHIVLSDYARTGDGLLAALQVLAVCREADKPVSEVCHLFDPVPQVLKSVRYAGGEPLETAKVKAAIKAGEERLNGAGRLVIRKSGTEPVIRVMAEGDDEGVVSAVVDDICGAVTGAA